MKHLKTFESVKNIPEVGDWVAVTDSIAEVGDVKLPLILIAVVGSDFCSWIRIKEVQFCSSNREDVEVYLQSKKYNL
jgi:hypothetical protein